MQFYHKCERMYKDLDNHTIVDDKLWGTDYQGNEFIILQDINYCPYCGICLTDILMTQKLIEDKGKIYKVVLGDDSNSMWVEEINDKQANCIYEFQTSGRNIIVELLKSMGVNIVE